MISKRLATRGKVCAVALVLGAIGLAPSASAAAPAERTLPEKMRLMLSQGTLARWYAQNPEQAPADMRTRLDKLAAHGSRENTASRELTLGDFGMRNALFNRDDMGLPQNQESVDRCSSDGNLVMQGTNDYRAFANPLGNFTGWHFSDNGGVRLTKEGLLPAVTFADGAEVPSTGDSAVAFDSACNVYMVNHNLAIANGSWHDGIGVYRTTASALRSCPGGDDPSCWPTRVLADQDLGTGPDVYHTFDRPWLAVGRSAGRTAVWVTYTDFATDGPVESTTIRAVRCDATLTTCDKPVMVSDGTGDVELSDVTVGPDGRTYVSWVDVQFSPGEGQVFVIKLRVAEAGSTEFGQERVVAIEREPMAFRGRLHANDFEGSHTYPKHDVKIVNGKPRVYVIWESCQSRPLDFFCEYPRIRLTFSDSLGAGWSSPTTISAGGDNYFATLSANPGGTNLAVAYWTSRFDPVFNNRQDIELATVDPNGNVVRRQRLTDPSNEPEADTFLGGDLIGEHMEVTARGDRVLMAFNANYRKETYGLGSSLPTAQQDNYLVRGSL